MTLPKVDESQVKTFHEGVGGSSSEKRPDPPLETLPAVDKSDLQTFHEGVEK